MAGPTTELTDAAVRLIAELPDDALNLRMTHLRAVGDLRDRIAAAMAESAESLRMLLERVAEREDVRDDVPISEYLTGQERAEVESSERRWLDAERAGAALDGWADRSGWDKVGRALTGMEPPARGSEVTTLEDPDRYRWDADQAAGS